MKKKSPHHCMSFLLTVLAAILLLDGFHFEFLETGVHNVLREKHGYMLSSAQSVQALYHISCSDVTNCKQTKPL